MNNFFQKNDSCESKHTRIENNSNCYFKLCVGVKIKRFQTVVEVWLFFNRRTSDRRDPAVELKELEATLRNKQQEVEMLHGYPKNNLCGGLGMNFPHLPKEVQMYTVITSCDRLTLC